MKFWKQKLLTSLVFLCITTCTLYTSCEKDSCANLTCKNGGSCSDGYCHCPAGYEGSECETQSTTRYLGVYGGYHTCDGSANVIDTATVIQGHTITTVGVVQQSNPTDTMYGTVTNNGSSTYTINIAGDTTGYYSNTVAITLQSTELKIVRVISTDIRYDSTKKVCTFTGNKP